MDTTEHFPLVLVRWRDASNMGRWEEYEEAIKNRVITVDSVGHFIHEEQGDCVLLAHGISDQGAILSTEVIPAESVLEIIYLKEIHGDS